MVIKTARDHNDKLNCLLCKFSIKYLIKKKQWVSSCVSLPHHCFSIRKWAMGHLGRNEGKHIQTIRTMKCNCIAIFLYYKFTKAETYCRRFIFKTKQCWLHMKPINYKDNTETQRTHTCSSMLGDVVDPSCLSFYKTVQKLWESSTFTVPGSPYEELFWNKTPWRHRHLRLTTLSN